MKANTLTTPVTVVLSTLAHLLSQLPVEIRRLTIEKLEGDDEYSIALGVTLLSGDTTQDVEDLMDLDTTALFSGSLEDVSVQLETTFPKPTLPDAVLAFLQPLPLLTPTLKISAIKLLRSIRGYSLKEAKEEVEQYIAAQQPATENTTQPLHRVDIPVGQGLNVHDTMYRFADDAGTDIGEL